MGKRPNPAGWQGGSEDFTYLRVGMEGRNMYPEDDQTLHTVDERQNSSNFEKSGLTEDQGVF